VARAPTQNFAALEEHLRKITAQIETLNQPSAVEKAVEALRAELSQMAETLREALPRRALEALETQVRVLAERLERSKEAGADTETLVAIERALIELHNEIRQLRPAENLLGFEQAVKGLAQKIDHITANHDPATFHQLESAINALRGIVSHVASNEALGKLAQEVQSLAAKIDRLGATDAFSNLEARLSKLTTAMETRGPGGETASPQLEGVLRALHDKLERLALTQSGDQTAVVHLEDRIVKLVEKLDASQARLSQLEAVERGLTELLVHIDKVRGGNTGRGGAPPQVDALKRDIARTQDSLEAVHGTLGHVVDRLAMIETDIRGEPRAPVKMPSAAQLMPLTDTPAVPLSAVTIPNQTLPAGEEARH
jgi:localization factor PodJL